MRRSGKALPGVPAEVSVRRTSPVTKEAIKVVSRRQSEAAKALYPALKAKLCSEATPEPDGRVTLVYFGAGWDMTPLRKKDYRGFNHFVFIDALPKQAHYNPDQAGYQFAKDRASFTQKIITEADKHRYKLEGRNIGNRLVFRDPQGQTLEYVINMTVEEALKNATISRMIRSAKWLHVQGFHPSGADLRFWEGGAQLQPWKTLN